MALVCVLVFFFKTSKASTGLCRLLDCLSVLCYTVSFLPLSKVLTVSISSVFNLDFVPFVLYLAPLRVHLVSLGNVDSSSTTEFALFCSTTCVVAVVVVVATSAWAVAEEDPPGGVVVAVEEEDLSLLVVLVVEVAQVVVAWAEAGLVTPTSKTRPSTPYRQTSVGLSLVKVGWLLLCLISI